MEEILLIGSGGHAKSIIDSIEKQGIYNIVGFLDLPEKVGLFFDHYKVIGTDTDAVEFYKKGIKNAFICIGYLGKGNIRTKLYNYLVEVGYNFPVIRDETAILAENVFVGCGTFIGKGAIINSNVHIGNMCIINTGVIIEHDCTICDYSHISVGSVLCGGVTIGEESFIGANSTIIQECRIGEKCIIGAGTTIVKEVEDNKMVYGEIWKNRGGGGINPALLFSLINLRLEVYYE